MRSVLIVEDNKDTQRLISTLLKDNKYKTYLVSEGNDVINKFNQYKPDIVLLDIALPGLDGISILKQLKEIPEITQCHYITGGYSIFIKIYTRDNEDLKRVLVDKIQAIPGVSRTETFISLEESFNRQLPLK